MHCSCRINSALGAGLKKKKKRKEKKAENAQEGQT